jgi:hypothetical protein
MIDNCNELLYGLPDITVKKLQKVQNNCVRFLFNRKPYYRNWESITPLLKQAHFLPVTQRIDYRIAPMVFKCVNNIAPPYITKCISMKGQRPQTLHTNKDYFTLQVPPVSNLSRTCHSFSYCGPAVWNNLLNDLRTQTVPTLFKKT